MSLEKEIKHDQTDSLVPLLYAERGGSLQHAVDTAVHTVQDSVTEFDRVADTFLINSQDDPQLVSLSKFIDGCNFASTANLNWGYVCLVLSLLICRVLIKAPKNADY
ncbi:hypothetical protein AbraCBS73388_004666 [Aspergillus brasiliensis]|uniref:Uncharacterized protein n=1 Tax=Aspergillus brasiliensis TaxID=319629 RepID=A0A9W5Z192_9EURO|nr:hypothetical protein AbraCBS73388_004666 [Aspergillus brasiliensis]